MPKALQYNDISFLYAERQYAAGELLLTLGNKMTVKTDPYRMQVTADYFIVPPSLLYHSCAPNAYVEWDDLTLRAGQDIVRGDLVTYHYGTSELDYTVGAFTCQCGSPACVGEFRGFMYLEPNQQLELYEKSSPYIKSVGDRPDGYVFRI